MRSPSYASRLPTPGELEPPRRTHRMLLQKIGNYINQPLEALGGVGRQHHWRNRQRHHPSFEIGARFHDPSNRLGGSLGRSRRLPCVVALAQKLITKLAAPLSLNHRKEFSLISDGGNNIIVRVVTEQNINDAVPSHNPEEVSLRISRNPYLPCVITLAGRRTPPSAVALLVIHASNHSHDQAPTRIIHSARKTKVRVDVQSLRTMIQPSSDDSGQAIPPMPVA